MKLYHNSTQFTTIGILLYPIHHLGREIIFIGWKVAFGLININIPGMLASVTKRGSGKLHI